MESTFKGLLQEKPGRSVRLQREVRGLSGHLHRVEDSLLTLRLWAIEVFRGPIKGVNLIVGSPHLHGAVKGLSMLPHRMEDSLLTPLLRATEVFREDIKGTVVVFWGSEDLAFNIIKVHLLGSGWDERPSDQ